MTAIGGLMAMTAQRTKMATFQEGLQNSLLAAAEAMTPAERKEYAEKLKQVGKRDRDRDRDKDRDRGPPRTN